MKLQEMFGRRSARGPTARKRARQPHVERLEDRAVPASFPAANIHDLVASLGAANGRGGADTIAAAIGRPPAPGHSLVRRELPSLDTYVFSDGSSYSTTSTYDAQGNLTSSLLGYDTDADGVVDLIGVSTYTYERDGSSWRMVVVGRVDTNADGVIDYQYTETSTYDAHGNLAVLVAEPDYDGNGVTDYRLTVAYTYDAHNNPVQVVQETAFDHPGLPDVRNVTTMTYDAEGNITSTVIDTGGDGVIDGVITYTNAYDSRGRLASVLYEQDYYYGTLPDGNLDVVETGSHIPTTTEGISPAP